MSMSTSDSATTSRGHRAEDFRVDGQGQVQIGDRLGPPPAPVSPFRNKYFDVPRNATAAFTGREEICEQLHARCLPSSPSNGRARQKRYVIHGLGGSGKTQVCLKFVEDHREEFWGVFWVDASSAESLNRGCLQIAEICSLEAQVAVVQRWLSSTTGSWVLILDNADDVDRDLSPYFPVGNRGVILITSRNPECKVHATVGSYELGAMSQDEAVTLILKTAEADDPSSMSVRGAARSVVRTLGYLALAITQAGAVIRQGRCTMEEYCTLYARRRKELLSQKAIQGGEDYRYTVYTTWEVSRQMIKERSEAGQDALELLKFFGFLHHEGIPEAIFLQALTKLQNVWQSDWMLSHLPNIVLRHLHQEWDVDTLRMAASVLLSFSLIYRDKRNLMSMHPLVHTWVRDRLDPPDEDRVWTQTTSMLALSIPRTFRTADYRFRQALIPHIDTCLSFRKEGIASLEKIGDDCQKIATGISLVYSEAGRAQEALQLAERTVEVREKTLGEEHPTALRSKGDLTVRYNEAGDNQKAIQLTECLVKVMRRKLGEEHPDTVSSIHSLALLYSDICKRQEALELTERVVKVRKRTLGEEHIDTLGSMHNLSNEYAEAGKKQEALQLTERVLEARKKTLGEDHPDTLGSIHNLAIRYSEAGGRQEALQLMERVVEVRKKTLGEDHPGTLTSIYFLAGWYNEASKGQEALQLMERVVGVRKRTSGEDHPDTLASMYRLAIWYHEVSKGQEALQLMKRVLEVRNKILGERHPDTIDSIEWLAIWYSDTSKGQEALQLIERLVEVRKMTLGEDHPKTLDSIFDLATWYYEASKGQEALQLMKRVLEARNKTLGEEQLDTLASMYSLAIWYSEAGERQEALQLTDIARRFEAALRAK